MFGLGEYEMEERLDPLLVNGEAEGEGECFEAFLVVGEEEGEEEGEGEESADCSSSLLITVTVSPCSGIAPCGFLWF